MAESSRAPASLPTYALGDEGKPNHFNASATRETAAEEAKSLEVGDAAFILRSDRKWAYSILTEKVKSEDESITLHFILDEEKNLKRFPAAVWGKYIRVIKVDESELAKLKEEEDAKKATEKKEPAEAKPEEAKPEEIKSEEAKPTEEPANNEDKNEVAKNEGGNVKMDKDDDNAQSKDNIAASLGKSISEMGSMFTGFLDNVTKKMEKQKIDTPKSKKDEKNEDITKEEVDVTKENVEAEAPAHTNVEKSIDAACTAGLPWLSSWGNFFDGKGKTVTAESGLESNTEGTASKPEPKPDVTDETDDDTREPAECTTSPVEATAPVFPKIKLLQTPIKFFKAATMKDDPEVAALANTSFAEDQAYSSLTKNGTVVVEHDPSAAENAEKFERERIYGPLERQGVAIIETNCSVETEPRSE